MIHRTDQRDVDGVTMVEVWHCPPPPLGWPYMATIQHWQAARMTDRQPVSQVDIYAWEKP